MKAITFLKKNLALLKRSLIPKDILFSLSVDVVSLAAIVGFMMLIFIPIQTSLERFDQNLGAGISADTLSPEMVAAMQSIFYEVLFLFGIFIVGHIFIYSASRLFLWRRLTRSRAPSERWYHRAGRYLRHFGISFFIFLILIFGPMLAVSSRASELGAAGSQRIAQVGLLFAVLIFIYIHLNVIFNHLFARSSKVFSSLKNTFTIAFIHIGYFIFPYAIFILGAIVLSFLVIPINWIFAGSAAAIIVYLFLVFLEAIVLRLYLNRLIAILCKKFCR